MKIQGLTEKINQTLSDKDNTINYLEEEQQKYQELTKEVKEILTKYGVSNFTQLSNGIQGLLSDRKKYKDERDQARLEITEKDDRIAQLEKLFHGTAKIFSKQHNYVDQLKERLEQEKQNKGISPEQMDHLQADIKRLDEEKQQLTERIEELEDKEKFLKEFRDKELTELRKEKLTISDNYEKLRTDINDVLKPINLETTIAENATEDEILLIEIKKVVTELTKEQGWWDKWINDEAITTMSLSAANYIYAQNIANSY
ncbi:1480_t:CDS:1 [Entrophospora sp. SA101]|nr:11502_t:CDS:1 [Entrophospora sp. SA101]CAJ0747191.1 1480_t:CDS:1 [Entrophospora sp. SA101]CAJ0899609.1 13323_t:CDS:1 [Entrophospora sp. SA101]